MKKITIDTLDPLFNRPIRSFKLFLIQIVKKDTKEEIDKQELENNNGLKKEHSELVKELENYFWLLRKVPEERIIGSLDNHKRVSYERYLTLRPAREKSLTHQMMNYAKTNLKTKNLGINLFKRRFQCSFAPYEPSDYIPKR